MQYDILGVDGEHTVQGADWLAALGQALEVLGLNRDALAHLVIDVGRSGELDVSDPASGLSFRLLPVEDLFGAFDGPPLSTAEEPIETLVPEVSELRPVGRPNDLASRLADIAQRVTHTRDVSASCVGALDGLQELVAAESGAVLLYDGEQLVFRAAFGPVAAGVTGSVLAEDTGVAGFTFQLGLGVVVNRADLDMRHDKTIDRKLNYRTRNIIAAPVKDLNGDIFGVLQLVNAPVDFKDWHLEAAQGVASDLAAHLSRI